MRALVLLVIVSACAGTPKRHFDVLSSAPAEYPGTLRDPKTIAANFFVRQTLTVHTTDKQGKPVEAELEAVLQKQGDTLQVVGFGPMSVKAFTLVHKGDRIVFDQFYGPQMPFSPRNIVVDIHRVFFMRLPPPTDPKFTGVNKGELDGEHVEETWKDGQLRATTFTRPGDPKLKGAIRIQLSDGCDPQHCEPETAQLRNEWFGYTLSIANEAFERL